MESDAIPLKARKVRPAAATSASITTWVPQQPLSRSDGDSDSEGPEPGRLPQPWRTVSAALPSSWEPLPRGPLRSRRRAVVQLLSSWEGRDALLQLAQAVALLAYGVASPSIVPSSYRKRIHIASESIANARRFLILGRWATEVIEVARGGPRQDEGESGDTIDNIDEIDIADKTQAARSASVVVSGTAGHSEQHIKLAQDEAEMAGAGAASEHRADVENHGKAGGPTSRRRRFRYIGPAAEALAMAAEGCEVGALIGGSGMIWRILGGKLAARQRRGLERVALFMQCASILLFLRLIDTRRRRLLVKLRAANGRLLEATDMLHADDDARFLLHGHRLTAEDTLLRKNKTAAQPATALSAKIEDSPLRQAETEIFANRKRMQLLRLERMSQRAELVFLFAELFLPRIDHTRLEAWTGLIASFCHMSRLSKAARWSL